MVRRVSVALVLAASVLAVLPGSPAQARVCSITHQCTTHYYSDSSMTTIVGGLYEDCDGSRYAFGTSTEYATFSEFPC